MVLVVGKPFKVIFYQVDLQSKSKTDIRILAVEEHRIIQLRYSLIYNLKEFYNELVKPLSEVEEDLLYRVCKANILIFRV